jgi:hypothetical protein
MDSFNQIGTLLAVAAAGVAWLAFAEHPTAKNFRRAVIDTLAS